jgi:hypothetical protein
MAKRVVTWAFEDVLALEWTEVDLGHDRLHARGTLIVAGARGHRLDYELETAADWRTTRLHALAKGEGWTRELELRRGDMGWSVVGRSHGAPHLPRAGGRPGGLGAALDCDLAGSPLTNTMPIRRHRLATTPGEAELVVAFVEVPALRVRVARQGYRHVAVVADGSATVRYRSLDSGFFADLVVDDDGIVLAYPGLARLAD